MNTIPYDWYIVIDTQPFNDIKDKLELPEVFALMLDILKFDLLEFFAQCRKTYV